MSYSKQNTHSQDDNCTQSSEENDYRSTFSQCSAIDGKNGPTAYRQRRRTLPTDGQRIYGPAADGQRRNNLSSGGQRGCGLLPINMPRNRGGDGMSREMAVKGKCKHRGRTADNAVSHCSARDAGRTSAIAGAGAGSFFSSRSRMNVLLDAGNEAKSGTLSQIRSRRRNRSKDMRREFGVEAKLPGAQHVLVTGVWIGDSRTYYLEP